MVIASGIDEQIRDVVLTPDAVDFVRELHERFGPRRDALLTARAGRSAPTEFLAETADLRADDTWTVVDPRADYEDRRVEITGPTDRKLVINALNSGARGFMADFEDASSPTWANQSGGHLNLIDAVRGTISYESPDGRHYGLGPDPATLMVRPRGLHLPERHVTLGARPVAGAFVDFGLHAFHNARHLSERGLGVYFYLPKIEHYLEARLWNDVLAFGEVALGLAQGTMRATVLVETLPAAFQMEEVLWELRERSYGLNAGRWDYIFSVIKSYRDDPGYVLPDRAAVTPTVPFMRAYADLLVRTCHRRGAYAIGGMAALIPSRTDDGATERAVAAVSADKRREASLGFDGTWVAHPDVVPVACAEFDAVLGERPHQLARRRDDVPVDASALLDVASTPGEVTEVGLRNNISVAFEYLSSWLCGRGAVSINNLMEDTATAEIARAQIWQWIRHGRVTRGRVVELLDEETARIEAEVGPDTWERGRPAETRAVFERLALTEDLPEFLTLLAYEYLD